MSTILQFVHVLAGLVVLTEALNKLERADPFLVGLSSRQVFVEILKVAAWALIALGAGGALVAPLVQPLPGGVFSRQAVGLPPTPGPKPGRRLCAKRVCRADHKNSY